MHREHELLRVLLLSYEQIKSPKSEFCQFKYFLRGDAGLLYGFIGIRSEAAHMHFFIKA